MNKFFKVLTRLHAGKEAYDPLYKHKAHVIRLKYNKDKLKLLHERVRFLSVRIHDITKKNKDDFLVKDLIEEVDFLKSKIELLKV